MPPRKRIILLFALVVFITLISLFIQSGFFEQKIRDILSSLLSDELGVQVTMNRFDLTLSRITVTDFTMTTWKSDVRVAMAKVVVDYSFSKLLLSGFSIENNIRLIRVFEPEVSLWIDMTTSPPDTVETVEDEPLIPDLAPYFAKLNVEKGRIYVYYHDETVTTHEQFTNLNAKVENRNTTHINLSMNAGKGRIKASGLFDKGFLKTLAVNATHLSPTVKLPALVDSLSARVDGNLLIDGDQVEYQATLQDIGVRQGTRLFDAEMIRLEGDLKRCTIKSEPVLFAETGDSANRKADYVILDGTVTDPLGENPGFTALLEGKLDLNRFEKNLHGRVLFEGSASGTMNNPILGLRVQSDSVRYDRYTMTDIVVAGHYARDKVRFTLEKGTWEGNEVTGNGLYDLTQGLELFVSVPQGHYVLDNRAIKGIFNGKVRYYNNHVEVLANLDHASLHYEDRVLGDISMRMKLINDSLSVSLRTAGKAILIDAAGNIADLSGRASIRLHKLDPMLLLGDDGVGLPYFSGRIEAEGNRENVQFRTRVRCHDPRPGRLDGIVRISGGVDFVNNRTMVVMRTSSGIYNNQPFRIDLLASGTLDSLHTHVFRVNDEIDIEAWVTRRPVFDFGVKISGRDIRLSRYTAYEMEYYSALGLAGRLDIEASYNFAADRVIDATIVVDSLNPGTLKDVGLTARLSGNPDYVKIHAFSLSGRNLPLLDVEGGFSLTEGFSGRFSTQIRQLSVPGVLQDSTLAGVLDGQIIYELTPRGNRLDIDITGHDLVMGMLASDSLVCHISQDDRQLHFHRFESRHKLINLDITGDLGYNFITEKATPNFGSTQIRLKGDILQLLSNRVDALSHGRSDTSLELEIVAGARGLEYRSGHLTLKNGQVRVNPINDELREIDIDMEIVNDLLDIRKCDVRVGRGQLTVRNQHSTRDKDIAVGGVSLGRLLVKTGQTSLDLHIPGYMPEGNLIQIDIRGRDSEALVVEGPIENLAIIGDVLVSNGNAIYPPGATNLLSIIRGGGATSESDGPVLLPFSLDVRIVVRENIRYVTHPVNLLIKEDSYLHLLYKDGAFTVRDAVFASESGTLEMFGTMFEVDQMQIALSQFLDQPKIVAGFYKKTSDGTMVTLKIIPADNTGIDNSLGNLQFILESDDPSDKSQKDILAKLRYNRSRSEISSQEEQDLIQEEAIVMAEQELQSSFISPFISPVESFLRKSLRMDYFYIKPGIVKNLVSEYVTDENPDPSQPKTAGDHFQQFGTGILLNNMTISTGRYVYRNLFLGYEVLVQEITDIEKEKIIYTHDFDFRYDLPWKLRLTYKFRIDKNENELSHELFLERSFRF